jgi:hypothetical protein
MSRKAVLRRFCRVNRLPLPRDNLWFLRAVRDHPHLLFPEPQRKGEKRKTWEAGQALLSQMDESQKRELAEAWAWLIQERGLQKRPPPPPSESVRAS